jgi:hypothetical protein
LHDAEGPSSKNGNYPRGGCDCVNLRFQSGHRAGAQNSWPIATTNAAICASFSATAFFAYRIICRAGLLFSRRGAIERFNPAPPRAVSAGNVVRALGISDEARRGYLFKRLRWGTSFTDSCHGLTEGTSRSGMLYERYGREKSVAAAGIGWLSKRNEHLRIRSISALTGDEICCSNLTMGLYSRAVKQ